MTATGIDPQQHDTKLATLYFDLERFRRTEAYQRDRIIRSAGVVTRRFGKETKRGWGSEEEYFSFNEAVAILSKREAREIAKTEAKAKKAARALKTAESMAHKMNSLIDQFGEDTRAAYRWTWDHKGFDNAYYAYNDMIERRTR